MENNLKFNEWQRIYSKIDCKLRKKHPNMVDTREMRDMIKRVEQYVVFVKEEIERIDAEIK